MVLGKLNPMPRLAGMRRKRYCSSEYVGFMFAMSNVPKSVRPAPRIRVGRSWPVAVIITPVLMPETAAEMDGISMRVPATVADSRQTAWKYRGRLKMIYIINCQCRARESHGMDLPHC